MTASQATPVDVLIVGAGPTGLTLALELARYDVSCTVLSAREPDAPPNLLGDVALAADSAAILDRLTTGAVSAAGCPWTTTRTRVRWLPIGTEQNGGTARSMPKPALDVAPADLGRILRISLGDFASVRREYSQQVVRLSQGRPQDEGRVSVTSINANGKPTQWGARFVVGADGRDSPVRDLLGLPFDGPNRETPVLRADIKTDLVLPAERTVVIDPSTGGRVLELQPLPDHRWRLSWIFPASDKVVDASPEDALASRLGGILGTHSTYKILTVGLDIALQRLAPRFTVGHVFLAGSAAHTFEPLGARGINSGVQDAENLGWKLAFAVHGHAGEHLIESYDAERRAVALADVDETDAVMETLAPRDRWSRVRRRAVLAAPGMRLGVGELPEAPVYRASPTIQPGCGALAPDLPVHDLGGWSGSVSSLRGGSMVIVAIGATAEDAHELAAPIPTLLRTGELPPFRLVTGVAAEATDGIDVAGAALGNFLVIRPDGHLAWKVNGENDPIDVAVSLATVLHAATGH